MPNVRCSCRATRRKQHILGEFCRCDWEIRIGYGVAVSLGVFEAKRLFVIVLEFFLEWQIIRLAGGFQPFILTVIGIILGFTCALSIIYTIRK